LVGDLNAKRKAEAHEAKIQRKESKASEKIEKEAPVKTQQPKKGKDTGATVKATVVKTKKTATK